MYYHIHNTPLGDVMLTATEQGLSALSFQAGGAAIDTLEDHQYHPEKFTQVCQQLDEYFAGTRQQFDVALVPKGSAFRQKVWQALIKIPYGVTISYSELAKQINNEKAVRAVGSANGANPLALIIPCHRVIGSNGRLTGYAGGLELKQKLLAHEGIHINH